MKRKNLLHFLLVALLIVTFVAVFAISASAETPADTDVYEVLDASGAHIGYAETPDAAKTQMAAGYTLKVLKDTTADLTLDMDFAYSIDATGVTVTGSVTQSAGTVTVKGGTFTTSGTAALWTMTGNASLTVKDGTFTDTNAADTSASSTVGAIFVFAQTTKGSVNIEKGTLTANGTIFYVKSGSDLAAGKITNVDLTVGSAVNGTSKKFVVYAQYTATSNITFNGGNWKAGRILHICGDARGKGNEGSITFNGNGTYHSMYIPTAAKRPSDYNSKCLVQNANDHGGLYIGRNFDLIINGGNFTFDGTGISICGTYDTTKKYDSKYTAKVQILGGSFKTTRTDANDVRQNLFRLYWATNGENRIENATFEAYASSSMWDDKNDRGIIWLDGVCTMTLGKGNKVIAHLNAKAVHLSGAWNKRIVIEGGEYTAEKSFAFQDTAAKTTTGESFVTFNGGTFTSGITYDNGVICLSAACNYTINDITIKHTSPNTTSNVLIRATGYASVLIKKGTFSEGNFLRIGGASATTENSVFVVIAPEKDSDIQVKSAANSDQPMIWYEGNTAYRPTLIIKGGTFTRTNTNGKTWAWIFKLNNTAYGNVTILGGTYKTENGAGIFGLYTPNTTNFRVLGGTFDSVGDFIAHYPGTSKTESDVTIDVYGKGTAATQVLTAPGYYHKNLLTAAGFAYTIGTDADNKETVTLNYTSTGVDATGKFTMGGGAPATGAVFNIYGGNFAIAKGAAYNLIAVTAGTASTLNVYGGTFTNYGGTSRTIKSEKGASQLNFYGGNFICESGAQEFIAFNGDGDGCSDVLNFYGAGTYNGITTTGFSFVHKGRPGSNSALLLTCDNANNSIDVTVNGGSFEIASAAGCGNMFFSWNNDPEKSLYILGGTFIGTEAFSRSYNRGDIYIKNATIKMKGGLSGLFMIFQNVRDNCTVTLDPKSTIGSFTVYRGTADEVTCDWATFFAGNWNVNAGKFDLATATGTAKGTPANKLSALVTDSQYPAITLLGDVYLDSTFKVTKNLTIFANGHKIHTVANPFEVADGVTLTIVDAVMNDDAMLVLNSGNVVLKNCTLSMFGGREMICLGGTANLTLENCTLTAPSFTTLPGNDSIYNGTYFLLATDFAGSLTVNGGTANGGCKLVVAAGGTNGGAGGTVSITGMTFAFDQYVVYDMWSCSTSYTLTDCSVAERVKKVFHICATDVPCSATPTYTISGGNYITLNNFVYIGSLRQGTVNLINVTATISNTSNDAPLIHVNCMDLNITGGTFTQKGNNSVLLYYAPKVEGEGERDLATANIKNATFISYCGVLQDKTNWYNESAIMLSCGVRATLENCTVKALGKEIGGTTVVVGHAVAIDGGAECTITGDDGYYAANSQNVVVIATNNPYGRLTVNGGKFTLEGNNVLTSTKPCSLIWNAGGITTVNGGEFVMPEGLKHSGSVLGGSYGSDAQQTTFIINGGSFIANHNVDGAISADGADITINGGYFASKGMCVARVLSGLTTGETTGVVATVSKAKLTIKGGVFVLLAGGRAGDYVAVVRAGGGSTYGTVDISGGTFINQRGDLENASVIFMNNSASSISVTGGTFLIANPSTTGKTSFFYRTNTHKDSTAGNKVTISKKEYTTIANTPICNVTVFGTALAKNQHAKVADVAHAEVSLSGTIYSAVGVAYGNSELVNSKLMESGAQVRLRTEKGGLSGLRFISTFSKATLDAINALANGATVEYGTLITTTENVINKANGNFTVAGLGGAANEDKTYIKIVAKNGITMNADGSMKIRAALVDIKEENYEKSFSAIAYAKIGDTYYYGDFSIADNSRSIASVAEKALADTTGNLPCYDENGVATGANTSRYTMAQQKLLYKYLGIDWDA